MVHGIANIGQSNRQQAASNGQQCFSAFRLFSDANLLIIKELASENKQKAEKHGCPLLAACCLLLCPMFAIPCTIFYSKKNFCKDTIFF